MWGRDLIDGFERKFEIFLLSRNGAIESEFFKN